MSGKRAGSEKIIENTKRSIRFFRPALKKDIESFNFLRVKKSARNSALLPILKMNLHVIGGTL